MKYPSDLRLTFVFFLYSKQVPWWAFQLKVAASFSPSDLHLGRLFFFFFVTMNCEISSLHRGVGELLSLLRCYARQVGRWLPKSATNMLRVISQKCEGLDLSLSVRSLAGTQAVPNEDFVVFLKPSRFTIRCRPLPSGDFPVHHSTNRSSIARDTVVCGLCLRVPCRVVMVSVSDDHSATIFMV